MDNEQARRRFGGLRSRVRARLRGNLTVVLRRALAAALFLVAAALVATPGVPGAGGERPRVPTLVASTDLPLGSTLSDTDVQVTEMPPDLRPAGALSNPAQAVGRGLVGAARRGEPLTDVRVAAGRAGAPGTTTVPLRLADSGVTDLLRSGTHVDVVVPGDDSADGRVLVHDATVVTVVGSEPGRAGAPLAQEEPPLILVSVPDERATQVAAAALGQPMTVTLR